MEDATLRKMLGPRVLELLDLTPEVGGPLAPMRSGTGQELASREVTRVCGYKVEKTGFGLCIAESLKGIEISRLDVHTESLMFHARIENGPLRYRGEFALQLQEESGGRPRG
jgi:hypothetical protein